MCIATQSRTYKCTAPVSVPAATEDTPDTSPWDSEKSLRSAGVSNTCQSMKAYVRSRMIFSASALFASVSST